MPLPTARGLAPGAVNEIARKLFGGALITSATEPTSDGLESGFFSIAVRSAEKRDDIVGAQRLRRPS